MASESTEQQTVSVELPSELADWLDEQASRRDVDRETLFVQLLASYRETAEFDANHDTDPFVLEPETVLESIDDALDERVTRKVEATVEDSGRDPIDPDSLDARIEEVVDTLLTGRLNEATNAVQKQLEGRVDGVEEEFQTKLEDVRNRVIQVKRETDSKAPSDHSHPEFDRLERLAETVDSLEDDISRLEAEFDETVPGATDRLETHAERLEEIRDRLQTVAWVVSDLRETNQSEGGVEAVERIKRAAARADIERAKCENCNNGVTLSLLTEPTCPHCDATVTNVEPSGGWFSDSKLLVASQLESGESHE